MRRFLLLVPLVVVFVVAGVALFRVRPAAVGAPAPGFTLPSLADPDERIALADLRGRPVVLNFWASWCDPCRDEAAELAEVARAHPEVRFLGVNILDGRSDAQAYEREFSIGYPSVQDTRGVVADRYEVTGAPETFFIDADGRLVGRHIGAFTGQLDDLVAQLPTLGPEEILNITGRGETRPVP